ncbi:phosphate transporter [Halodesulfurarchaeum formicicum]|uniref:Phosphate transporter n=1 Tax=Halodesulfurarchaeum formicicum TaxID=1873524 RepID=A0A1D8S1R8_9EURY|nr:inorganic phosphate transporter [Halodesulfurarchaeum formicicum]AOW79283.1 phosphate transporter [Halodesulfurarchaeum formicicum]
MSGGALLTLAVASLASLFMAWAIGAGSSGSTPFAPAVGANAISVMRAGFLVGILGFAGAALQGANVSETVGTGLIQSVTLTPAAVVTVLAIAATLVASGVFLGYPIATAFTVTGAVVGVGLALGGAPAWAAYYEIVGLWAAVPFVGGGVAFATARLLRSVDRDQLTVPALGALVGVVVANIRFDILGGDGGQSIAESIAGLGEFGSAGVGLATVGLGLLVALVLRWDVGKRPIAGMRHFLVAMGGLVAFSAGGSQVGLAVGPLIPLLGDSIPLSMVLVGGGLGLLVGSWTGAPRMIKAIAQDYSSLGPRRSIAALIPSFVLAQTAVLLGVPVSFNEIVVSAIMGSGLAVEGREGVSAAKMGYTVLAWVGSLVLAIVVGYGGFRLVSLLF